MRSGDWIYVETGIKEMALEITKMDIGLVGWDQRSIIIRDAAED